MLAAVYARISDDREGAGLGVSRQEQDCRALAERLGWTVAQVYTDNDLSAFNRRKARPGYQQLLDDISEQRLGAVIAWHNDRLHRSVRELEDFIDLVERSGVAVQTVKAGFYDLTTPSGRLNARLVGAVAQYESEHKRERNLRKAQELADMGQIGNGGPRPFGYTPDRLRLDPVEAPILASLYSAVLSGSSLTSLVRDLTDRGIKTSQGNDWSVQSLRYTLLRPRNMGWRVHKGRLAAPAVWDAVVDREVWEQVKAVLTDPKRRNLGQVSQRYLLTGFLHCGRCGGRLKSARGVELPRFSCRKAPNQINCGGITVRYDPLEEHVVALLLARLERDADLTPDLDDPSDAIRERIATIEAKLERLADAFANEDGDVLEFRRVGRRYREQIAELRSGLNQAAARSNIAEPAEIRADWPLYSQEQRRAVLAVMLDRITVGPAVRGRNSFDPDRLTVDWR